MNNATTSVDNFPRFNFDNSYSRLKGKLFAELSPVPVKSPEWVVFNHAFAAELGLGFPDVLPPEWAAYLAGNALPDGAKPIAQAYAGHQFGHFTMLGDGRAILLGEHLDPQGRRFDIQLKGSGRTPFSRGGDGRATLTSMLREFLMSEAIHHLGIPTTRALAVVATGEPVVREDLLPGAVLTRVAASHIRVGTFEYIRNFLGAEGLQDFTDYVLQRHFPDLLTAENKALAFIEAMMHRQADLVAQWMRVGFIHGVMNTDNMAVSGETIDYGPCAFMNAYDPQTVFSSIDSRGRYAFGNQSTIAQWNLACLAGALLPLIDADENAAVAKAKALLDTFQQVFQSYWLPMMRRKLGMLNELPEDPALIQALLDWMRAAKADYTQTFLAIQSGEWEPGSSFASEDFGQWMQQWQTRMGRNDEPQERALALMRTQNPVFIPRNHWVEAALQAAAGEGDFRLFNRLWQVWQKPYEVQPDAQRYQGPPAGGDQGYRTFCGT